MCDPKGQTQGVQRGQVRGVPRGQAHGGDTGTLTSDRLPVEGNTLSPTNLLPELLHIKADIGKHKYLQSQGSLWFICPFNDQADPEGHEAPDTSMTCMNLQHRYTTNCSSSSKSHLLKTASWAIYWYPKRSIKSRFQNGSRHTNILFLMVSFMMQIKTVGFGVTDSASPLHLNSLLPKKKAAICSNTVVNRRLNFPFTTRYLEMTAKKKELL